MQLLEYHFHIAIGSPEDNQGTFRGTSSLVSADFSVSSSLIELPRILFRASAIQSVVLPSSLTTYGSNCFRDCGSLTSVEVKNPSPATIGADVFTNLTLSRIALTVPATAKTVYQGAAALRTKDIEQAFGFVMYPNLVKDELHVFLNKKDLNNEAVIILFNLTGQVVKKVSMKNSVETVLELSGLSSGFYIYER